MANEEFFPKTSTINFTIRNTSPQKKRLTIFGAPIEYGATRDLLALPEITEADIRNSLIKGELYKRVKNGDIVVVSSSIDLVQYDASQKTFLANAGVTVGLAVEASEIAAGSINDASLDPTSHLAVANSIIFSPASLTSGNGLAKTWNEVMAYVAASNAPTKITLNFQGLATAEIILPIGLWDMKGATIEALPTGIQILNVLKVPEGCTLKNVNKFAGPLNVTFLGSTTRGLTWDTPASPEYNLVQLTLDGCRVTCGVGCTLQPIHVISPQIFGINIVNSSLGFWQQGAVTTKFILADAGTTCQITYNKASSSTSAWTSYLIEGGLGGTLYVVNDGSANIPDAIATFSFYTGTISYQTNTGFSTNTTSRPQYSNIGTNVFDLQIGRPVWNNGTKWVSDQSVISTTTSIWISNSTGNDTNDGYVSRPLKTFAEFVNRYGISPQVSAVLTITFLDATVAEDIIFTPYLLTGGRVVMDGTPVAAGSGTLTSSPTQRAASTGTCLEVTDTAQTWAPFIGTTLFRHTLTGGESWCAKDTGSNKCRLSTLTLAPPTGTPFSTEVTTMASGNAYTLWTLPVFTGVVYLSAQGSAQYSSGVEMWVRYMDFRAATTIPTFVGNMTHLHLVSCRMSSPTYSHFLQEDIITSNMCVPIGSGGVSVSSSMASIIFYGGLNLVTASWAKPLFAIFYLGHLFQGCGLQVSHPAMTILCTDAMIQDWSGGAVLVTNGGLFQVNGGGNNLSGVSTVAGSYIFNVQCGVVTLFVGANWATNVQARGQITATYDFVLNSKLQGSPYVAGSGIAATEVTYTFAHLDAAAGAAGFGGSTSRLDAFASMTKKA